MNRPSTVRPSAGTGPATPSPEPSEEAKAAAGGFAGFAAKVATFAGRPIAFVTACAIIVIWVISGPIFGFSDTWQLVINTGTTIVTFLMVFVIQNAQNRDGMAIQVKLDELIRATHDARNTMVGIEHLDDRRVAVLERELEARAVRER